MDNDLDRSVRLLEDALSPGAGLLKKNVRIPRRDKSDCFDLSLTLAPHEIKNIMFRDGTSLYEETITTILHTDKSVTGKVIQANNIPWKTTIDNLFSEFYSVLQSHSGSHSILDVISDLARCCSDVLKIVQGLRSKVATLSIEEEIWLEEERNTWRLLFILYQDRLFAQNGMQDITQYFGSSEKLCVENLFKRDSLLRESQLVIDWLECNAADKNDDVLHFSDSSVGWENTLHQLQFAENIAFGSSRKIVSQMDPDAPHYEKKPLHDLDMEDEAHLSKRIFTEIRCGKLEEAQKLCRQCGHSWRAAIFEGWRLFHDPNIKENPEFDANSEVDDGYEEIDSNELREIEGNSNRDVWKNIAIKYCKQEYLNPYERAAVGSFCGFVSPILPVCDSWKDNLWAYMKSMVDIRVESEIRDCCVRNKEYMPLPEEYWVQRMSLNEVFASLESSANPTVREESRRTEHIIQKYIILDEIPSLFGELDEWTEDNKVSTHYLRFYAHLILFLDQIGQGHNRDITEKVLKAYIKRLMGRNEAELIPFYVSKLNPGSQIYLYSQYLEKIIDTNERKSHLTYAEQNGLDVLSITKQVVENIRNIPNEIEGSVNLQQKITDLDKYKISALDWVNFYDNQKAEALIQANAIIFTFLTLGKLDAAQLALNKVSSDTVDVLLSEGNVGEELNQAIKEHFSYKAYLEAHEAFNEWFKQCKCKPMPPDELPDNAQFPEKVAHQHRISQYKAELERWKLTMAHLVKNAKTLLYNVLLFPEGWLVGAKNADYLRSTCIPEIVLLLYSILFESGCHEESVQLADVIASEKYHIYNVYSKEKLGEILIKFCESSIALLNAKKDPWGNEMSA
ncbi:nuclear pore complex protein Nup107 [Anoplophora glabripennis]|nr:nuclear pore complex protein Nup107 [Anoplophora glabripennis]